LLAGLKPGAYTSLTLASEGSLDGLLLEARDELEAGATTALPLPAWSRQKAA